MTKYALTNIDPSTDGNVLTSDGTDWVSEAPAGGAGSAYYDITAGTGGDYATLEAALTAITDGQTLLILDTLTLSANASSTADNIRIIGKSPAVSRIVLGAYTITLSGTNIELDNFGMDCTTQGILITDTTVGRAKVRNLSADVTGAMATSIVNLYGTYGEINNVNIKVSATTTTDYLITTGGYANITNIRINAGTYAVKGIDPGQYSTISNCHFKNTNNGATRWITTPYYGQVTNCYFESNKGTSMGIDTPYFTNVSNCAFKNVARSLYTPQYSTVTGCYFYIGDYCEALHTGTTNCTVSGNYFNGAAGNHNYGISDPINDSVISGNYFYQLLKPIQTGTGSDNTITGNTIIQPTSIWAIDATMNANYPNIITNNYGGHMKQDRVGAFYYNASGGAVVDGSVVVNDGSANVGYFSTTTTAGDANVLGIVSHASDIDSGDYGMIITEGHIANTVRADGTDDIAVGDYLCTSTTAGVLIKAGTGDTAIAKSFSNYTTDAEGTISAVVIPPIVVP